VCAAGAGRSTISRRLLTAFGHSMAHGQQKSRSFKGGVPGDDWHGIGCEITHRKAFFAPQREGHLSWTDISTSLKYSVALKVLGWYWKFGLDRATKEKYMKPSTKDQVKGKLHEEKGKLKEAVGKVTNNPDLKAEGQDEKFAGTVQKKVGQIEKVLEK